MNGRGVSDALQELTLLGKSVLGSVRRDRSPAAPRTVPHPIPKGMEDQVCPITGLSIDSLDPDEPIKKPSEKQPLTPVRDALAIMEADPDIAEESLSKTRRDGIYSGKTSAWSSGPGMLSSGLVLSLDPSKALPLNISRQAHVSSRETRLLVQSIGGLPALRRFTASFYQKCFADPHIDKFIRSHNDPHGERFATWIAEKFGDGTPWTDERRTRPQTQLRIGREIVDVAHDRSSAHVAAWHSPKREPHKVGDRFTPEDARIWMRLHFWAARETGMFCHTAFMDYYVRFIAHFVSVYSKQSPPFARESARWSVDPQNVQSYITAGHIMVDVIGKDIEVALADLPAEERVYTGSGGGGWPYELTRH